MIPIDLEVGYWLTPSRDKMRCFPCVNKIPKLCG